MNTILVDSTILDPILTLPVPLPLALTTTASFILTNHYLWSIACDQLCYSELSWLINTTPFPHGHPAVGDGRTSERIHQPRGRRKKDGKKGREEKGRERGEGVGGRQREVVGEGELFPQLPKAREPSQNPQISLQKRLNREECWEYWSSDGWWHLVEFMWIRWRLAKMWCDKHMLRIVTYMFH